MFRQTLLCHGEVPLRRALDDGALERLWLSSSARVEGVSDEGEALTTPDGYTMTTSEPHVLAPMHALAEAWPAAVAFPELLERARAAVGPDVAREVVAERLRDVMLQAHLARVVGLYGCPPPVASGAAEPGAHPRASALARAQYAAGAPVLSSLLHTNVKLDEPLDLALLPLLDGTRDRAALGDAVPGQPTDAEIDAALTRLAALGLLHA
jgi:hypothetical protein